MIALLLMMMTMRVPISLKTPLHLEGWHLGRQVSPKLSQLIKFGPAIGNLTFSRLSALAVTSLKASPVPVVVALSKTRQR